MVKQGDDAPILVAQVGPLNGQRWPLRTSLLVGRDPDCDIVIAERQVSRHHARFITDPNGTLLQDMGSKNGTHRNGQPIEASAYLEDGDIIQIAFVQQFVFLSSDATLPLDAGDFDNLASPQIGRLKLEKRSRRVWIGEKEALPPLSVSQFQLLEALYASEGQVVPRQALILKIWGEDQAILVSEQALDALIRRLRERLAELDSSHEYIVTVRGHGMRLDNPPV